jgi:ABC-type transport system involved in multi-copper enzyme maturation permease subunit
MGKGWKLWHNPILVKEFRTRMRSWKALLLLTAYLAVIGFGTFVYIHFNYRSANFDPGQSKGMFIMMAALHLVVIGFVAPGLTAGTIAGERERQTLNILLTTHLTPTQIVVSKLVSSLSFLALLVFSTLPIYVIVFLYGGISPVQLVSVFGFYLMAMILFGSIGMVCSAWFKRTGVSTVVAYGIMLLIMGGTFLLAIVYQDYMNMKARLVPGPVVGHVEEFYVSALNPVINLVSMFVPQELFLGQHPPDGGLPMRPWLYFLVVYMPLSVLLIAWSVRLITPVKKRKQKNQVL